MFPHGNPGIPVASACNIRVARRARFIITVSRARAHVTDSARVNSRAIIRLRGRVCPRAFVARRLRVLSSSFVALENRRHARLRASVCVCVCVSVRVRLRVHPLPFASVRVRVHVRALPCACERVLAGFRSFSSVIIIKIKGCLSTDF